MTSKDDLRQMMRKSMADRKTKVDSPFAKYNAAGQLQCSLCNTPIKTEALWPVHLKSKSHKERQTQYELSQKKAASKSAPAPSPSSSSSAKAAADTKRERSEDKDLMPPPPAKKTKEAPAGLPAGFFDQYGDDDEEEETNQKAEETKVEETKEEEEEAAPATAKSSLPAGFFDDPTMDAQMRGAKTPAKMKEEAIDKMYEKYQETISETLKNSDKIEVESLLKDESIDEEGDSDVIDREQEKREREEKMAELKKKSERVKELRQKLATINKPKVVEVDDDDLVSYIIT